jgi:hypothetical protein
MELLAAMIAAKLLNLQLGLKRPVIVQAAPHLKFLFSATALTVALLASSWHGDHQERIKLVHELQ